MNERIRLLRYIAKNMGEEYDGKNEIQSINLLRVYTWIYGRCAHDTIYYIKVIRVMFKGNAQEDCLLGLLGLLTLSGLIGLSRQ